MKISFSRLFCHGGKSVNPFCHGGFAIRRKQPLRICNPQRPRGWFGLQIRTKDYAGLQIRRDRGDWL